MRIESEEEKKMISAVLQANLKIRELVADKGTIECPMCGGVMPFAKAPNKHVRAKCKTEDCISFME